MDEKMVVSSSAQVSESSFISKVYLWMSLGLGISAAASLWLVSQPALLKALFGNAIAFFGVVIAELVLVVWLSARLMKMSAGKAMLLFGVYSFLNGLTLTGILLMYTGASVMTTFAVTGGTFFFFSVYGMTTKKDLTSVGSLAMMGLIGVVIASVVNMFLHSPALMWVITFVGIGVFLGLIAYDTQKLKAMHAMSLRDAELGDKLAVMGALALYLDFINLFILLLRIFGKNRD